MRKFIIGALCFVMLGIVNSALAVDTVWTDATGNHRYVVAGNWSAGLKPNKWWTILNNVPAYPGVGAVLDQYASGNICWGMSIGNGQTGNLTLRNDTSDPWGVRVKAKGDITVGVGVGGLGIVDIVSAGDGLVCASKMRMGKSGGTGIVTINAPFDAGIGAGARLLTRGWMYIGNDEDGTGVINLIDGNLDANVRAGNEVFFVGYYGNGTLNISGGTADLAGRLDVGGWYRPATGGSAPDTARGHIEMTGGLLMADHIYFGLNAKHVTDPDPLVTGTIHQTGGEFIFDGANQSLALSRVNQAINKGWWTTGPQMLLNVFQDEAGTHVTVLPPLEVDVDILPHDDPNLLTQNTRSKGRLPIAILGSEEYDIGDINLVSLSIAGTDLVPLKTPSADKDENGDGINDLVMHFSRRDLIMAMGLLDLDPGTVVSITVEGTLSSGRVVFGTDDVTLIARMD